MNQTTQIAKHLRDVHFGGNWSASNLKSQTADIDWIVATTKIGSFNTIAVLVFHINYYIDGVAQALKSGSLDIRDKFSFDHPPIESEADWQRMLEKSWADVEAFAQMIEQMPNSNLIKIFFDEKYGTYHRNLFGIIEHAHYHLGQIAILKKLIAEAQND